MFILLKIFSSFPRRDANGPISSTTKKGINRLSCYLFTSQCLGIQIDWLVESSQTRVSIEMCSMWTLCERAQDCWYLKQKAGGRTWNNSYSEQSMEILWFSDEKGPLEASWVIPYASRSHQTLHNPMMPQTTRNLTHSIMPQTTPKKKFMFHS